MKRLVTIPSMIAMMAIFVGQALGFSEGSLNSLFGNHAGLNLTTGAYNTFIGDDAGYSNTTGGGNTFLGEAAGSSNKEASGNTFIGNVAGLNNTTGFANSFLGDNAGASNTTGFQNAFLGSGAGLYNTTGSQNSFLGTKAGYSNTTGFQNSFLGYDAGFTNTTGFQNTFLGYQSALSNTTGSQNTFLGTQAGTTNTTGSQNTFLGEQAGYSSTSGNNNTFLGPFAGYTNTTGTGNVFLGYGAGYSEPGSNRLYIDNCSAGLTNKCYDPLIYGEFDNHFVSINGSLSVVNSDSAGIGMLEIDSASSVVALGFLENAVPQWYTGSIGGQYIVFNAPTSIVSMSINASGHVGLGLLNPSYPLQMANGAFVSAGGVWTNASSREYKENIRELGTKEAIKTLEGLTPVKYNYKVDQDDRHVGFISEDVPELVATKDRKGLGAMDIVAVLTKVVQGKSLIIEQQQQTLEQQNQILKALSATLARHEAEINRLKSKYMTARVIGQE